MSSIVAREAIPHRPESDTFDVRGALRRLLNAVFGHKLLLAGCCLASVSMVFLYISIFPPTFVSAVMLTVEGERVARDTYYFDWNLYRKGDPASEGELMTAATPVSRVVEKLGLTYDEVYHSPISHLQYLWAESAAGKAYKALKDFVFRKPKSLNEPSAEVIDAARTVQGLKSASSLEWVSGTDTAYLVVRGPTPGVAEQADTLIDEYLVLRREKLVAEAQGAFDVLLSQVRKVRAERATLMAEHRAFEEANGLFLGFEKERTGLGLWREYQAEIHDLEVAERSWAAQVEAAETLLKTETRTQSTNRSDGRNSARQSIENKLVDLRADLALARQRFRDDAPEVLELEGLIAAQQAMVAAEPELVTTVSLTELNSAYVALRDQRNKALVALAQTRAELAAKRAATAPLNERLKTVPELEAQALEYKHEMELLDSRYGMLMDKFTTAEVSLVAAQSAPSSIQIIERAPVPFFPEWPKTKLLLAVAVLVGLVGGIGLALFFDVLGNRVTLDRLSLRTDLPVYATIELGGARTAGLLTGPTAMPHSDLQVLIEERRMYTRANVPKSHRIGTSFEFSGGRVIEGELTNVSMGGAAVRIPPAEVMPDERTADFSIRLPDGRVVSSQVDVGWMIEGESGNLVGVSFKKLGRATHVDIRRFIGELERNNTDEPADVRV